MISVMNIFSRPMARYTDTWRLAAKWGTLSLMAALAVCQAPTGRADMIDVVLYDGIQQTVTPDKFQPTWLAYAASGGSQQYSPIDQAVRFDTTASMGYQGGYSNHLFAPVNAGFPTLNRHFGYSVGFRLEMLSESSNPNKTEPRAGFSIIAVSSDVGSGTASSIEIGFRNGSVFSQNDTFTAVAEENSGFNPVGIGMVDYRLQVLGSSYELWAGELLVLSGGLRDYTGFEPPFGFPDPYEIPNYLFLGDNTTSAQADILLQRITVSAATVPEPSSLALLACGLLAAVAVARHRRRAIR